MKQIWHPYWDWECLGMYNELDGISLEDGQIIYYNFLKDIDKFDRALNRVVNEWTISCENFLSNDSINKIAWLGQASVCIEHNIPRVCRGGFKLLSSEDAENANKKAKEYLMEWIEKYEKANK